MRTGQDNATTKTGASSGAAGNDRVGRKTSTGNRESESDEGVISQVQDSGREIASRSVVAIGSRTKEMTSGFTADISSGLHTLAEGLRKASSTVRKDAGDKPIAKTGSDYIDSLAMKVDRVSDYLERSDPTSLARDMRGFARRNPTVFVGGAFVLGFAVSRLVRSSAASQTRGHA